ncbi:MAG TPA: MASE1 domain-containing protein [Methylomirabilota bacterium]|nr:MASE1 domain-containing protein [Methylomirabilota bacterium]
MTPTDAPGGARPRDAGILARDAGRSASRGWPAAALLSVLCGLAYFASARLGLSLAVVAEQVTLVWPPTGIALASVLLGGSRVAPAIWIAAFLANSGVHEPLLTAAAIATGNTLEAVVGAAALRALGVHPALARLRDTLAFIAVVALAATPVSATVGVTSLVLSHLQRASDFGTLWRAWWLGDTVGALVVGALLLAWAGAPLARWSTRRLLEAATLAAGTLAAAGVIAADRLGRPMPAYPLEYLIFPFVTWGALRFGGRGATSITAVASALTIWATHHGAGLGRSGDPARTLIVLQLFVGVLAMTGLLLAAATHERDAAERRRTADYAVTHVLAESTTLVGAAPRVLRAVGDSLDWQVGALWAVDGDARALRCVACWASVPDRFRAFTALTGESVFSIGVGLPGRVWASEQASWVSDVTRDSNFPRAAVAAREGLHGAFAFPVRVGGRLWGVAEFFSRRIERPDAELLERMTVVGTQLGHFVERQAAEAERAALLAREQVARGQAERTAERLRRVQAVTDAALARLDLESLPGQLLQRVRGAIGADTATVLLVDAERGELVMAASDGTLEMPRDGVRVPFGRGFAGSIAARQAPAVVDDVATADPAAVSPALGGLRSLLGVPLQVAGEVLGVLHVGSVQPRRFTDGDVALLQLVADRLALVVQQRKLAQAERAARNDAEAASRAKDEFLAMLGHELRNPIGAITNAVGVLGTSGVTADHRQRMLEIIGRQVRHLARLIEDLLDVASVTSGKVTLHRRPVDLSDVVDRCLAMLTEAGRLAQHRLTVLRKTALVDGDPARLEQVVTNLLDNAAKYTPAGERIEVEVTAAADAAVLRVRDSGVGIAPELLPRIFEPFAQAAQPPDRAAGGLGLGLALVRRLVELHGGRVEARSLGPGQGSEFVVRLPLLHGAAVASGTPGGPAPRADAPSRRVLIVEDNRDARESLRVLLEARGHLVEATADAPSGLARLAAFRPDLALVDLGLPGLDGFAVARWTRAAAAPLRGCLLVALTGYGDREARERALAAGFDAHLVKPVHYDELAPFLRAAPDGDRPPDGAPSDPGAP